MSTDSKKVATSSAAAVASSGSSDSDKTSSPSSQPVVRRLKYEMCKNWREKGSCKYGEKCLFAHGASELTKRSSLNGPEPVKKPEPEKPAASETKNSSAVPEKKAAQEPGIAKAEESKQADLPEADADAVKLGGPIFETPLKTDSPSQIQTPAFSASQDMSTKHSTG